ncbi:MAG: sigma-70 family RNA polymerase sigma factor [Acidobacteriota bacterium]
MPKQPEDDRLAEIGRLYDRLAPSLFRYAVMILASSDEAEDVVHRVFTRLIARDLRAISEIDGYARRAVRNECFNVVRGRRHTSDADIEPLLEVVAAVDAALEDRLAVEQALRDLPADQREVLHLKIFEGWTFPEIAALSGESVNTVASRYRYGLAKLRTRLS